MITSFLVSNFLGPPNDERPASEMVSISFLYRCTPEAILTLGFLSARAECSLIPRHGLGMRLVGWLTVTRSCGVPTLPQSIEDRVQRHMQVVAEAEQRLVSLHSEKEKVV